MLHGVFNYIRIGLSSLSYDLQTTTTLCALSQTLRTSDVKSHCQLGGQLRDNEVPLVGQCHRKMSHGGGLQTPRGFRTSQRTPSKVGTSMHDCSLDLLRAPSVLRHLLVS